MILNLKAKSIASVAYTTSITDRSVFENLKLKGVKNNVKVHTKTKSSYINDSTDSDVARRTISTGDTNVSRQSNQIWPENKKYTDTSKHYRRSYRHNGLWSRITSNSGGSLPKEISFIGSEQISTEDRATVESFCTASRGIRKCSLTIFATCAEHAGRSIGTFEDCQKRPYSCRPISLSVRELSKSTHAGTDTLGKKNDLNVQNRVISQLRDLFRSPTSRKVIGLNPTIVKKSSKLDNVFKFPELIFHRFQATYDKETDTCTEKSRVVWCVPYLIVALENIFFGQIFSSVRKKMLTTSKCIYPIGLTNFETGQRSVKSLRDEFRNIGTSNGYKIYSLDFSKYDATIPNWSKDLFFAFCKLLLNLDEKQSKVYDFLRIYVKHTPFVFEDNVLFKQKGISSGLYITNFFDSWWNLTIIYFVEILKLFYEDKIDEVMSDNFNFESLYLDPKYVVDPFYMREPLVRVMGDDSIMLCDEYTMLLHAKVCKMLGMKVTIKHITHNPEDDIMFLGRYWESDNRPNQSEEYMALRIVYAKWYKESELPFSLEELHLYRMLSICLPLKGGKSFLDKYLFDYPPYEKFQSDKKGFVYMKDFIEDQFRYVEYEKIFQIDTY